VTALRLDVVILTSAISAGIHGALVPEHVEEGAGAGAGFLGATVVLALLVVALTRRPCSRVLLSGAALVFAGLIGSYAAAVTTGFPVLHPEIEPVARLAVFTKAVEATGLATALSLLLHPSIERNTKWSRHAHVRFLSS
jgi:hypothetical protein